jgi:hypothetical protein
MTWPVTQVGCWLSLSCGFHPTALHLKSNVSTLPVLGLFTSQHITSR